MSLPAFDEPDELRTLESEAEQAVSLLKRVIRDVRTADDKELGHVGWAEQWQSAATLTQTAATAFARASAAFAVSGGFARLAGVEEGTDDD
jgi:hypothetical protein